MVRCIAIGRGRSDSPHFYFYDIDSGHLNGLGAGLRQMAADALIYSTKNGYHVLNAEPLPKVEPLTDDRCPGSAVRLYPHPDYAFIQPPKRLCRQVYHLYASIFPELDWEGNGSELAPCNQPLKFGVYSRPKPL